LFKSQRNKLEVIPLPRLGIEVRQKFLVDTALLGLLALIIVVITSLYIGSEHNFHWWIDWYSRAIEVAAAFRDSPSQAIQGVQRSLIEERNLLYTLPLVPFIWLFGSSRIVYEVALALVYLLPFALVMGAIATQLVRVHPQLVFWSTAILTLLIPVSWVTTFIGIPDTGGPVFLGLATLLYLQDVRLKQWWRIPLMGLFVGLSILLRRHYVYGGLAFFGALSLQALVFFVIDLRTIPRWRVSASLLTKRYAIARHSGALGIIALRNLLGYSVRIGLIAISTLITLMIVAPEFTYRAMTVDYKTLYTSWTLPYSDIFELYTSFYGWATWLLVALGFLIGVLGRDVALPALSFMGLWGICSLLIWLVVLRYGNVFYSLHITPLVVIGLVTFIWTIWSRLAGNARKLVLGVVGCYLVSNLVLGLTPIGKFDAFFRPLFAINIPPLVRTDYDEVVRLVNYLRQIAPHKEPIYVVGYQRLQLDSGLVKAVERVQYPLKPRKLNILLASQVDSRDAYPFEMLLKADYVVVPNPLPDYPDHPTQVPAVGEWLPNKEVKVVQVVFDAFTKNWEFAQDFKRLPVQFTFENGAVVSVYQRVRPTSVETAVRTIYAMQQEIGRRPGSQLNWMILSERYQPLNSSFVNVTPGNTHRIVLYASDREEETMKGAPPDSAAASLMGSMKGDRDRTQELERYLLYIGSFPESVEVSGAVTFVGEPCVKASLQLTMLNKDGQTLSSTEPAYFPNKVTPFRFSAHGKNATYLLLDLLGYDKNNLINSCTLELQSLAVSAKK
jgi:hypothetical protein